MSSWPGWNAFNGPHLAELGLLKVCLKLPFISIYREQIKVGKQLRGCLLWSWWGLKRKNQKHGLWIASRIISVILNQVALSFLLTNHAHYKEMDSEISSSTLVPCKTPLYYLALESRMPHVLHRCWKVSQTKQSWIEEFKTYEHKLLTLIGMLKGKSRTHCYKHLLFASLNFPIFFLVYTQSLKSLFDGLVGSRAC